MSDVVSVLVHNLPSVPSHAHVYTLYSQLLLTQVKVVQPTAAPSRGSCSADTPIIPVPRPRPTPRTTVHRKSYHTVSLHGCSDTATPSRSVLHDTLGVQR